MPTADLKGESERSEALFNFSYIRMWFPMNTWHIEQAHFGRHRLLYQSLPVTNVFDRELENITFKLQHSCLHLRQKLAPIFNFSVSLKHGATMYVKEMKSN